MKRSTFGPLGKFKETIGVFLTNPPSPRELLANRRQHFNRVHAILPSNAIPGESLSMTLQVWDQCERIHTDFTGTLRLETPTTPSSHPEEVSFGADDEGVLEVEGIQFESNGTHYLTLTERSSGETFVSNPVRVSDSHEQRVFWGDIHLHSVFSDGTKEAARGYRFGRDVMDLDVAAYTDHDTMGFFIPPQWQQKRMHREFFDQLCDLAAEFNDDGSFVTLPAYEWTKQPNMGGHINVYFESESDARLFDSLSEETNTYEKLWDRLRAWTQEHDSRVVTIPHHPAEAMYPFDFSTVNYDDDLAPLVEVYSQWGSSYAPEEDGNELPLKMGQGEIGEAGHYVQDAHRLGYKVGMLASADFHGPYPGHSLIHTRPHLPSLGEWRRGGLGWGNIWRVWDEQSYPGGLTAFLAPELSREAIMSSLAARSVYGTTQPDRMLVDFRINGIDIAAQTEAITVDRPQSPRRISLDVAGTAPIEEIQITKNNECWQRVTGTDDPDAGLEAYTYNGTWTDETPITGMTWDEKRGAKADVYTVRVKQTAREKYPGMAWVGPLWVESEHS